MSTKKSYFIFGQIASEIVMEQSEDNAIVAEIINSECDYAIVEFDAEEDSPGKLLDAYDGWDRYATITKNVYDLLKQAQDGDADEIYSSWTINEQSEQKQPVVIDTHGNFRNTTGGIIFSGTVILQDEDSGREWPCSGEHSQRDYNWGKFWPDDDFESCPESPEIVELNDEEEAK